PATAGEGDDRLRAGNRALQRSLRGLIADGLTHRTRGELHEVLFQHAHRRLQLEPVRLLLLQRVAAGDCLTGGGVAHGEHDRRDEQRHQEFEQREPAAAGPHCDPRGFWTAGCASLNVCVPQSGWKPLGVPTASPRIPLTVANQPLSSPALTSAGRTLTSIRSTPGTSVATTCWRQCQLRPAKSLSPSVLPVGGCWPDSRRFAI